MKKLILFVLFMLITTMGYCEIKWVDSYSRRDGTYVTGHYRDTSNDGNPYNNANYLGYNRHRRSPGGFYGD